MKRMFLSLLMIASCIAHSEVRVCDAGRCDDNSWIFFQQHHRDRIISMKFSGDKLVSISPDNYYRVPHDSEYDEGLMEDGWQFPVVTEGIVSQKYADGQVCYHTTQKSIKLMVWERDNDRQKFRPNRYIRKVPKKLSFCDKG